MFPSARRRQFPNTSPKATDNKFQIQAFAGGEIVPRCRRWTRKQRHGRDVPHCQLLFYRQGPDFRALLLRAVRAEFAQQNAWFQDHGGQDMLNEFGKKYKLYAIAAQYRTQMAAGSARRSTALTISTASRCGSADGPAKPFPSSAPFPSRSRAAISIRHGKGHHRRH